jgi:uncharacterized membrane protein YoaK (UPF0700 family)
VRDALRGRGAPVVATSTTLRFAVLLTGVNAFIDANTFMTRGGVFANVQSGNIIISAIDISARHYGNALAHLWPILAFLIGILISSHIKSGRAEQAFPHPLRWTMAVQSAVVAAVGFVPASAPRGFVTIPISLVAATQMGLFRNVGDLPYFALATTGNLMRFIEAGYTGLLERQRNSHREFGVYGTLTVTFVVGAVIGAFATQVWGVHAMWLPAGFLALTLVLFMVDEARGKEP